MESINNSQKSFSEIQKKYNNFMVPSYEILVDEKEIEKKDFFVTDIKINLSTKDKAGMANFSVSNCYDSIKNNFSSILKSTLKLGSTVKISLGYSKKNIVLFSGYIDSISYEFAEIPQINVNCLDVMALLMKNKVEERKSPEKTIEQIVKDIFGKYNKFITSSEMGKLQPVDHQIVQNEDDYKFVKTIAEKNNCDFFSVAGKVYICNMKEREDVATTLSYGENVMNFSREFKLSKVEVTAYGKNDKSNETFKESYTYETNYPHKNGGEETSEKIIVRSPRIDSIDKAKNSALNKANGLVDDGYSSNIQCIGIPELIPGKYVKLENFDEVINGKFYITEANHSLSPGNYTVSLNISNSK